MITPSRYPFILAVNLWDRHHQQSLLISITTILSLDLNNHSTTPCIRQTHPSISNSRHHNPFPPQIPSLLHLIIYPPSIHYLAGYSMLNILYTILVSNHPTKLLYPTHRSTHTSNPTSYITSPSIRIYPHSLMITISSHSLSIINKTTFMHYTHPLIHPLFHYCPPIITVKHHHQIHSSISN